MHILFFKRLEQLPLVAQKKWLELHIITFIFSETRNTQRAGKLIILPQFTFIVMPVVEFKRGGTKFKIFLHKHEVFQRNYLHLLKWDDGKPAKFGPIITK